MLDVKQWIYEMGFEKSGYLIVGFSAFGVNTGFFLVPKSLPNFSSVFMSVGLNLYFR